MNPFTQLLRRAGNQPPVGTWLMSGSPLVAEAAGHAGFDWGVVDMEHAPLDMMDVVHLLQAIAGTRMVPVVRVPWNDTVTIKRVLDAGATTLLTPMVQNAGEAHAAVAATRYPPEGVRGMSGMSRAARYGVTADYIAHANKGIAVIAQLETLGALQQLEAISAVPGIDALFIGPADLSASLGMPGNTRHRAVVEAMNDAVRRCKILGKPIGTIGIEPESVASYRAAGFDYLAVNSDLGLLVQAAQRSLAALHPRETEHVHDLARGTRPAA